MTEEFLDDVAERYYKNYYGYEMDEEFSAKSAVSEALTESGTEIDGYELWIP